ncbi:PilZ domain-containing protein [Cellvibrio sp.]|uniref:PilZ domain-containing protein n=1 Tax=Cellvibrio sp. TaxID=1965322 RepID=UPI00396486D6
MRNYIRHPTSIPIHISAGAKSNEQVVVSNLSAGGLSFETDIPVRVGSVVDLSIPCINPDYQGEGVIVWRRSRKPTRFEVGVRFTNDDEYFRVRMVEQVCQIEEYRQQLAEAGRKLTSEEAAYEWIARFAADFGT